MGRDIYGDLWGEVLTSENNSKRIHLHDNRLSRAQKPTLVIPNLLALMKLRDYCDEIIKKNQDYFKNL